MDDHRQHAKTLRHEIGNMLMIAQANLEAMLDGVVEATQERLEGTRDALATAAAHLRVLTELSEHE